MVSDDTLKARIVAKMHRNGFYKPRGVSVANVAKFSAPSHDVGRAKEHTKAMAHDDSAPVVWKVVGQSVMLETDSESWAASWIRRHDPDELPWNLDG